MSRLSDVNVSFFLCLDRILGKWPNTYTLTKALAEDLVRKECDRMPVGVFRPAIVTSTFKEPVKGWIDNLYGPTGVGKKLEMKINVKSKMLINYLTSCRSGFRSSQNDVRCQISENRKQQF